MARDDVCTCGECKKLKTEIVDGEEIDYCSSTKSVYHGEYIAEPFEEGCNVGEPIKMKLLSKKELHKVYTEMMKQKKAEQIRRTTKKRSKLKTKK